MDAMKQFHIVRRLAPLLSGVKDADIQGMMIDISPAAEASPDQVERQSAAMIDLLGRLTVAVSSMSDQESEYIIGGCLSFCQRRVPGGLGWTPVWNAQAKRPQFDDIELPQLMQIVGRVLGYNVGGFISAFKQISQDGVKT